MRVLHVLEALEGGTALHVRTLARQQRAAGHEVAVVTPARRVWGATDTELAQRLDELAVPVFPVRMHRTGPHPVNAVAAARLDTIVRRWAPEVVHTHSTAAGVLGRAGPWARGKATVHTPNGVRFADVTPTVVGRLARWVERFLAPFTTVVIGASPSEAEVLARAYPRDKVVVVANGIPVGPPPPPLPDRFRVVAVNRFVYQKDPQQVVRVLADLRRRRPEAEAVIVGYGEMKDDVRRLIADLDPGIVVSQEPGPDAIAGASVLLLASRWEGAPYVLLEAMDRGRPAVATDVVGSRDTIVHGQTGFLFPWGDVAAGAARLAELADDRARLLAMGGAARTRLESEYTVEAMAEAVEQVYAVALAGRKDARR